MDFILHGDALGVCLSSFKGTEALNSQDPRSSWTEGRLKSIPLIPPNQHGS